MILATWSFECALWNDVKTLGICMLNGTISILQMPSLQQPIIKNKFNVESLFYCFQHKTFSNVMIGM
jgi:hypothetical protein